MKPKQIAKAALKAAGISMTTVAGFTLLCVATSSALQGLQNMGFTKDTSYCLLMLLTLASLVFGYFLAVFLNENKNTKS